jgi:branched-chain amino acid transport system permease protein
VRAGERLTDAAISGFLWTFRIVVVLIVVVGSFLTLSSGKYSLATWIDLVGDGLTLGSIYALIALGYTMVYGILRMINFAHGDIFAGGAFGGYFAAVALAQAGVLNANPIASLFSIVAMVLVAMAVATLLALGVERVAYRPLRNAPRLIPLISAIGASFFLEYTYRGIFGPGIYAYPDVEILAQPVPIPILNMR